MSFYDSNGDGIGDLQGIIQKLDYLNGTPDSLGIDAIWLSPIFVSPMFDFGYDVQDYKDINPCFGNLDIFKRLLKQAHKRDIKVILDMILNHTSDQHPWFVESRSSKTNSKRNWYIWKKPVDDAPPNNWLSSFGGKAWKLDPITNEYYLHSFASQQPDLNWRNIEVKNEFLNIFRFWLDMGVDGFRLDVINLLYKDELFQNNKTYYFSGIRPYDWQDHEFDRNRPETHEFLKELHSLIDSYSNRMVVGEIFQSTPGDSKLAASFCGQNDELNLSFNFAFMFSKWSAESFQKQILDWELALGENNWPVYYLSNHDFARAINRYSKKNETIPRAKIAAMMLFTLRGTPFIYYGEELGLAGQRIPYNKLKDPAGIKYWPIYHGRDSSRMPMPWSADVFAGFSTKEPWLPIHKEYQRLNVDAQIKDKNSLFQFYKNLIQMRKENDNLSSGKMELIDVHNKNILAYIRYDQNSRFLILLNFGNSRADFIVDHKLCYLKMARVVFSTHSIQHIKDFIINKLQVEPLEGSILRISSDEDKHHG